jgi:hypothetical protein
LRRHVDGDHTSVRADHARGSSNERVHPRATSKLDDGFAWLQRPERKRISGARETAYRFFGDLPSRSSSEYPRSAASVRPVWK